MDAQEEDGLKAYIDTIFKPLKERQVEQSDLFQTKLNGFIDKQSRAQEKFEFVLKHNEKLKEELQKQRESIRELQDQ